MKVLMLGGTADARKITGALLEAKLTIIYSVAGLVRLPKLACTVISGGFSKNGGLTKYLLDNDIQALVDATHPYAIKMTGQARLSCEQLNLPYFRFARPPWQQQNGDHWITVGDWPALLKVCALYARPFLTTGQVQQVALDEIATQSQRVIYRTAAASQAKLAENVQWIKALGPFAAVQEQALMQRFKVDLLVSKNSGGEATYGKLIAARALKIPVLMLERPSQSQQDTSYTELTVIITAVKALAEIVNERAK